VFWNFYLESLVWATTCISRYYLISTDTTNFILEALHVLVMPPAVLPAVLHIPTTCTLFYVGVLFTTGRLEFLHLYVGRFRFSVHTTFYLTISCCSRCISTFPVFSSVRAFLYVLEFSFTHFFSPPTFIRTGLGRWVECLLPPHVSTVGLGAGWLFLPPACISAFLPLPAPAPWSFCHVPAATRFCCLQFSSLPGFPASVHTTSFPILLTCTWRFLPLDFSCVFSCSGATTVHHVRSATRRCCSFSSCWVTGV